MTRRRRSPFTVALGMAAFLATMSGSLLRVMADAGPPAPVAAGATAGPAFDIEAQRPAMVAILRSRYYREIDEAQLLAAPVEQWPALLDDPYTHILKPEAVQGQDAADGGRYAGIGVHAHAEAEANRIVIDAVFDGSPAAEAGLRAGDELATVEGRPVAGLALEAALDLIRGPEGSPVTIAVRRAGSVLTATMDRRPVSARLVWPQVVTAGGRKLGVITVLEFNEGVGVATRAAADQLGVEGATAVVLDLRHNPGGLVAEAVAVASVFLPKGSPVLIEQGRHIDTTTVRTRTGPAEGSLPLAAVLVDGQSASSSEVVAGALRDGLGVPLVGHRTFGKGVIQDIRSLPGGGGLKFTFAEYLSPKGQAINRVGLTPDLALDGPESAPVAGGADPELQRALTRLAACLTARPAAGCPAGVTGGGSVAPNGGPGSPAH